MIRLTTTAALLTTAVTSTTLAQAPAAAPVNDFKLTLSEDFGYYAFDGNTESLAAFDTSLSLDLSDAFTVGVALPVYNQGNNTNIGDVTVSADWNVLTKQSTLLGVFDNWSLTLQGGVDIPTDTVFSSNNANPFIGGVFSSDIGNDFGFSQSVQYKFVGTDAYVPLLGTFTDSDILNFGSELSWHVNGELSVSADLVQQYYVDSSEYQLLLGPSAELRLGNVSFDAGVLLPISQSVAGSESDYVVTAGVGIEF